MKEWMPVQGIDSESQLCPYASLVSYMIYCPQYCHVQQVWTGNPEVFTMLMLPRLQHSLLWAPTPTRPIGSRSQDIASLLTGNLPSLVFLPITPTIPQEGWTACCTMQACHQPTCRTSVLLFLDTLQALFFFSSSSTDLLQLLQLTFPVFSKLLPHTPFSCN